MYPTPSSQGHNFFFYSPSNLEFNFAGKSEGGNESRKKAEEIKGRLQKLKKVNFRTSAHRTSDLQTIVVTFSIAPEHGATANNFTDTYFMSIRDPEFDRDSGLGHRMGGYLLKMRRTSNFVVVTTC